MRRARPTMPEGWRSASMAATRREFLKRAGIAVSAVAAATTATTGRASQAPAAGVEDGALEGGKEKGGLIDVNVSLGRWPTRRLPCDDAERLVTKLRSLGVVEAWAGSLDGLLHKDIDSVNARLADECDRHGGGLLVPFGSVNPRLLGWEEDLRRCVEVHRFRGIRLHPGYQGYHLEDPVAGRLLELAAGHRLIVQLALAMEDERMMHPLLRVEPVDPTPLAELSRRTPGLRVVLVNALRTLRGKPLRDLVSTGRFWVEISMLEGVGGLGSLLGEVPLDRVLFGSHAPLFYPEAAEMKLRESPLAPEQLRAVRRGNAEGLLAG